MKKEEDVKLSHPYSIIMPKYGHLFIKDNLLKIAELTKKIEYESVRRGLRLADRYHLTSSNYDKEIDQIIRDGLVFLPISRVKTYLGFSHTHSISEKLDKDVMIYGVVARDLDIAKSFVEAHEDNTKIDHKSIGKMLGYPDCCRNAFVEFWKKSYDPIQEIAQNTEGHRNYKNSIIIEDCNSNLYIHLRYFGLKILPYFPCSFKCEKSIEFSKKWLELMKELDEDTTNLLLELINKPSEWSLYNSQIITIHPYFMGRTMSYYDEYKKSVIFC